jgi:hypothetical protein
VSARLPIVEQLVGLPVSVDPGTTMIFAAIGGVLSANLVMGFYVYMAFAEKP